MGAGPHREHVGERVRRRNAPELVGVIDDGREEVDREHGCRRIINFPHRRVVARLEPEKELFLVGQIDCRREAVQRIFEVTRTPFRRSTALAGELRQRNFLLVAHGQSPFESNSVYQRRAGRRRPCLPSDAAPLLSTRRLREKRRLLKSPAISQWGRHRRGEFARIIPQG